jgi:hypothetical protein
MRNCRGQTVVELAIILPLAFFIIFILAELCFLFNAKQLLYLGSFQAARSYLVKKDVAAAETSLQSAISPAVFRETAREAAYLKVAEKGDAVVAEAVLLYRPLFPVLPLAKLMNRVFFAVRHSALVERAVSERSADGWRDKLSSRVPVAASVELCR